MWCEVNNNCQDQCESNNIEENAERSGEETKRFPKQSRMILDEERHSLVISWLNNRTSFSKMKLFHFIFKLKGRNCSKSS